MTAYATALPLYQFFDANGDPLVGGKLYSYEAGTTTPLATYTDSTGTVPNTNPIILDSNGQCQMWLGTNAYKLNLVDANDVQQDGWPLDNIQKDNAADELRYDLADSTNTSLGDAMVAVKQPLTGAVPRTQHEKNNEFISVKDFGAKGDGITDDSSSIQAAINAASAISPLPPIVYLPEGKYLLGSGLTIGTSKVSMVGESISSVWIINNNTDVYSVSIKGDSYNSTCQNNIVSKLLFTGNGNGILLQDSEQNIIEECAFVSHIGIDMSPTGSHQTVKPRVLNCTFQGVETGIHGGVTRIADVMITGCYFIDCKAWSIDIGYCDGGNISGNAFFSQPSDGVNASGLRLGNASGYGTPWMHISNNQFFAHNSNAMAIYGPINCNITNNIFVGSGASTSYSALGIYHTSGIDSVGNSITGNKFYRTVGSAISVDYLLDSIISQNIINGCGFGGIFTGYVSGSTLTLTAAVTGSILVGDYLKYYNGSSWVSTGATIVSLLSGIDGQVGATYSLSSSLGSISTSTIITGKQSQDSIVLSNCSELSLSENKIDGFNITRYWLNISNSVDIRILSNTMKNTSNTDLYCSGTTTIIVDYSPQAATYIASTTQFTPKSTESIVLGNSSASGGTCYVNLVSAVIFKGKTITVVKTDASSNALVLNPYGGQTINGSATLALLSQWSKATITSNGSNWVQIG